MGGEPALDRAWLGLLDQPRGRTKNTMVGEVMTPVHEPKPARPAPIDGWPFAEQRVFELRCLNGDDTGVEVQYKVSSLGGLRAVDELLGSLQIHLNEDPRYPCPVVELLSDSYQHQKWGKVYTPIFDIAHWASMDGQLSGEPAPAVQHQEQPHAHHVQPQAHSAQPQPAPAPAPEPQPAPRTRRTRAAAPPPGVAPAVPEHRHQTPPPRHRHRRRPR